MVTLIAAGADNRIPDVEEELERFDSALNDPPKRYSSSDLGRMALRQALGLAPVPIGKG